MSVSSLHWNQNFSHDHRRIWNLGKDWSRTERRYTVRMAVIDLDDTPSWFAGQSQGHLTADAARKMAGTSGS